MWGRGRSPTGEVHTKAIASATHLGGIAGARETAVGGRRLCVAVDDVVTTVAFLIPLDTSVDVTQAVTVANAALHGHVRSAGISGGCESSALDIIPTHTMSTYRLGWMGESHK